MVDLNAGVAFGAHQMFEQHAVLIWRDQAMGPALGQLQVATTLPGAEPA